MIRLEDALKSAIQVRSYPFLALQLLPMLVNAYENEALVPSVIVKSSCPEGSFRLYAVGVDRRGGRRGGREGLKVVALDE